MEIIAFKIQFEVKFSFLTVFNRFFENQLEHTGPNIIFTNGNVNSKLIGISLILLAKIKLTYRSLHQLILSINLLLLLSRDLYELLWVRLLNLRKKNIILEIKKHSTFH